MYEWDLEIVACTPPRMWQRQKGKCMVLDIAPLNDAQ